MGLPPDLEPEDLENLTSVSEIFTKLSNISKPFRLKDSLKPYYQDKNKCFQKFSYQSEIKTGLESYYNKDNLTINGHLLTSKNPNNNSSDNKRLILFFHWWKCGSLNNIYRLTSPYLKEGYDILFLELPFHMTRNILGMNSGELFITPFDQFNQSIFYSAVFENQMLLLSDLVYDEARYLSPFLFSENDNPFKKAINRITKGANSSIISTISHSESTTQPISSIKKFNLYLGKWSSLYSEKDKDRFLSTWKFDQIVIKPTGHYGTFLFTLEP